MQIPISTMTPDQLPAETPIKWDDVCKIVGSLYLDSYHRVSTLESHFRSILEQLEQQNTELSRENGILKQELDSAK